MIHSTAMLAVTFKNWVSPADLAAMNSKVRIDEKSGRLAQVVFFFNAKSDSKGTHSPSGSTRFYFLPAEFTFPPKNSAQH